MRYSLVLVLAFLLLHHCNVSAQNPLLIPPTLSGTTFNLNVQSGTQVFYTGTSTPTFGINGTFLAPTLIVNKGDSITLNVHNGLTVKTTLHWHGMHVAAKNDGGPDQIINAGATWSPSFKVRNHAGTYWYHPHGAGQTDLQVSKGIAGFLIVKDTAEALLNIPRTYGVDDIPLVIQTKAFDALKQISIASNMDTALFVNGTLDAYFDAPEQVVRFRLLNGSSLRSYQFGFSNNQTFYQIATDGGMLDSSIALTRLRLSPGERAEILVNFSGMLGQTIYLKSYASELAKGIYGADSVGIGNDTIPGYYSNPLNGLDFNLLKLNIVAQTSSPVSSIPNALIPLTPLDTLLTNAHRRMVFDTIRLLPADIPNRAEGPFGINNKSYNMDSINEVVYLNAKEIWTLVNHTLIAHPFHIHDVQFNILDINGGAIPITEHGWKDVVLVMPGDSVRFVTKFEDFADSTTPYMYHCHLLHHEDDGMMGSFIVIDTAYAVGLQQTIKDPFISIYPNPAATQWHITSQHTGPFEIEVRSLTGQLMVSKKIISTQSLNTDIDNTMLTPGMYLLHVRDESSGSTYKVIKE